jgi:hypothetical protein
LRIREDRIAIYGAAASSPDELHHTNIAAARFAASVIQVMLPYKRQFQALCFASQLLHLPPQINNSPFCLGRWLISYAVKPPLRNE